MKKLVFLILSSTALFVKQFAYIRQKKHNLTLPETEKNIAIRGYSGIKKHLYIGYSELKKLLFLSSKDFAALHDNYSLVQLQKRTQRTKIVKVVIFALALAITLVTAACLLFIASGIMGAIIKFAILLAVAAGSTLFFGITVHIANNLLESSRSEEQASVDCFIDDLTEKYIDNKIFEHRTSSASTLQEDIDFIDSHRHDITILI